MTRINPAVREQLALDMKRDYDAGASLRGLAAEYERSYGTVRNLLLEVKTTLRSRGGAVPRRRKT